MHITADISEAADAIRAGSVVAFPTDTFYALGADALNHDASQLVFELKGRPAESPLPVLIPSVEHVGLFSKSMPDAARDLAARFWPGALMIVMPARDEVPSNVTAGTSSVGIRVPGHPLALELLTEFDGGIIGTSANMTNEPPMKSAEQVAEVFKTQPGVVLEGNCGDHDLPSTVVDITYSTPRILRHGAIPKEDIDEVLGR